MREQIPLGVEVADVDASELVEPAGHSSYDDLGLNPPPPRGVRLRGPRQAPTTVVVVAETHRHPSEVIVGSERNRS